MPLGCGGDRPAVPRGDGDNGMAAGVRAVQDGGHRGHSKGDGGRAGTRGTQGEQQDGGHGSHCRGTEGAAPRDIAGRGHRRHSRTVTGHRSHGKA